MSLNIKSYLDTRERLECIIFSSSSLVCLVAHFDKNRRRREKGNETTKLTRQEVAVFTPASNDRIPHAAVRHDDKTRPKNLVTFLGEFYFLGFLNVPNLF